MCTAPLLANIFLSSNIKLFNLGNFPVFGFKSLRFDKFVKESFKESRDFQLALKQAFESFLNKEKGGQTNMMGFNFKK